MGGRGASSGISVDKNGKPKNKYGTQYNTVLKDGNIKFVTKVSRDSETLMETKTAGRVYVTVGGDDLISVMYFDQEKKRTKTIDLSHQHKGMHEHVHHGYEHSENDGAKGATRLNKKEQEMVDRVRRLWYNYLSSR